MTIGEKIRKARKEKNITQTSLCKDKITRNMLSSIERGVANPSLDTLKYIAARLSLPVSYLVSDDDNMFFYLKKEQMGTVKHFLAEKNYSAAIKEVKSLGEPDDECALILCECYFELGKRAVLGGSLASGKKYLENSLMYAEMTVYNTDKTKHLTLLYSSLANNLTAPLLELDVNKFEENLAYGCELDLFKYISSDTKHNYKNQLFRLHLDAKELIKSRDYYKALELLHRIESNKAPSDYNAYLVFSVYTDIEGCYKQLGDFENAYRYSNKRMSMIEGFKS